MTGPQAGLTAGSDPSFPPDFLIGASTSAHQIEGNNVNSDWWLFEREAGTPVDEPSGDACDSYHRYRTDISLVHDVGLNAYRFSIEWARIEPAEGEFSTAELLHYHRMLEYCRELGLTTVLTFHHFTLPRWLGEAGGFLSPRFPQLFQRYCDVAAEALGDLIDWACTINEPEGAGDAGWILGIHPPGVKGDTAAMWTVVDHVLEAHRLGAAAIRAHTDAPVGVTLALQDMQYEDGALPGESPWENNTRVSDRFLQASQDDGFVGLQTYTRIRFGPEGMRGPGLQADKKNAFVETEDTTQVGFEFYPWALAGTIRHVQTLAGSKPILLTENGIATTDDRKRVAFIDAALRTVHAAISQGADIRGYLYWSLLDNFEWSGGYKPKFGLVSVDRRTFQRTVKPSARYLGEIAKQQRLPQQPVPWPPIG